MTVRGRSEERRLVTSLFIDVVGSTELTVALGPERLKATLELAFHELSAIIEREGGTVEKYVGDAIYALFGAPITHPDDAERALRAAAGARAWADARAAAAIAIGVRVGLETGEAIVDLAAATETKQQMSVGAVVNTAARLQQRAEPGQVLVGPVAHDATTDVATFTSLGTVDLKGLGPLAIWALDELRGSTERRRLPFVGRESELELLRLARRRATTRSVLALVSGPPGQGKTRLVDEFLAADRSARILTARCRPSGEVGALAPLRELLIGERGADALDAIVAEAIDDATERVRVRDALAHSAGISASASLAATGRDERADEILNAWRHLLRGLAARGPLIIWVEDVHWAASEIVALIDRISLTGEPVLVIATARPEFAEEAGLRPSGDRFFIELGALEPEAARALAMSAGREDGGAVARAGGNPLFIVELARAREPGGALPLTVQGALGARLDDLAPEDRALLAHGAVIGETFTPAEAATLGGRDATGAARSFARLAELHYLEPVDGRYRFHHSLLRDVAYGRLLLADRLRLHARYAREARTEDPEVLAHHWWAALGGDEAKWVWQDETGLAQMRQAAFAAHLAAGRRQAALFATERAASLFDRAYALADGQRQLAEAKHALGDVYAKELRGDEGWRAYREARQHYAHVGDVPPAVYIGALKLHMRLGAFRENPPREEIAALAAEAEAVARKTGDPGTLARTLVYTAFRDMDPATEAADPTIMAEAVRLSERSDPTTRREILVWHASDLVREMQVDRALAVFDEIDAIPGQTAELDGMEQVRGRALIHLRRGTLAELEAQVSALSVMSRRMGPHLRTHADVFASHAAFARGDWPSAMRLSADTDAVMKTSPTTAFCVNAVILLGHGAVAHAREHRADEARALLRTMSMVRNERVLTPALTTFVVAFLGERPEIDTAEGGTLTTRLPYLAAAAVISRQRDTALVLASQLEGHARGGARFYGALAEAVREEVERDRNGPTPTHTGLRAISYLGWSEILGARAR